MTNSNAVQHRIMTTFSNMDKWKDYELVLSNLVAFFEGKHIHLNDGWKQSRGHSSLIANKEGRKLLKILKSADVSVEFGNDAPRGGAVGTYFKCSRKNTSAATFFADVLFLQKQRLNNLRIKKMNDLQKRKEFEDKIKQCDLKSLAVYVAKSEPAIKFTIVYFQRCELLRQYREKYGEEAYDQLRGQLDEARKDYLNNFKD